MIGSTDGYIGSFIIVAGVSQGDILESYMFMICLDYLHRMSIDLVKSLSHTHTHKKSQEADDIEQRMTDTD